MYLVDTDVEALLDTAAGAQAVNVSKHTVRKWRTLGWLDLATGERRFLPLATPDRQGNPRHRLGDLLDAERATRRSGKSHRRLGAPTPAWADAA
jgi:hypothetical protein